MERRLKALEAQYAAQIEADALALMRCVARGRLRLSLADIIAIQIGGPDAAGAEERQEQYIDEAGGKALEARLEAKYGAAWPQAEDQIVARAEALGWELRASIRRKLEAREAWNRPTLTEDELLELEDGGALGSFYSRLTAAELDGLEASPKGEYWHALQALAAKYGML